VEERGLSAYLAELIGTFLLVFFIASVVVLFVSTGEQASFGSDFAVIGLVHAFLLFGLIVMFGVVSGGHFNPAVTLAAWAIKRIAGIDAGCCSSQYMRFSGSITASGCSFRYSAMRAWAPPKCCAGSASAVR